MKASVRREYGPPEVLSVEEVETPTPADDEILVRVHAASVNLGDWEMLTGKPLFIIVLARLFGSPPRYEVPQPARAGDSPQRGRFLRPQYGILGTDIAGRVESVGKDVTRFRPGDDVFGMDGFGAFAEYICVPEKSALIRKPVSMTFEQAASMPQAAFIALKGIRDKGRVRSGQKVLINGAGGGAGTFAVQIAKSYEAEVTGVDGPEKLEMLRSIGADHVIDYMREDFTRNEPRYDVILDLAAYRTIFESRRALAPGGIYLMAGGSGTATWQSALLGPVISLTGSRRIAFLLADSKKEDLEHMIELFEAGKVTPVIDRCYPLAQAGDALQRVGDKRSKGKVIIAP